MGSEKKRLHPGDVYHIRQNAAFSVRSDASMGLVIERKELEKVLRTAYSGIAIIATINYMRYILN
jgi:hypothetical protein